MKKFYCYIFILYCVFAIGQTAADCDGAIAVCGNGVFTYDPAGSGNSQEISSCGEQENNTVWLELTIAQTGTLGFELRPLNGDLAVDYNFWVYGPNRTCGNLGEPIRCSTTNPNLASLSSNFTGMYGFSTETQAGPGGLGNGYLQWLSVLQGQTYYLAIDRAQGTGGFELEWIGSATAGQGAFPNIGTLEEIGDQSICEANSGSPTVDLSSYNTQLRPGFDAEAETITYYASAQDAASGQNPLALNYALTATEQTIYAVLSTNNSSCRVTASFDLHLITSPTALMQIEQGSGCEGGPTEVLFTGTPNAQIVYSINTASFTETLDAQGEFAFTYNQSVAGLITLIEVQLLGANGAISCSSSIGQQGQLAASSALTAPTITAPTNVCLGETVNFTVTGTPFAVVTYVIMGETFTGTLDENGQLLITRTIEYSTQVRLTQIASPNDPSCTLDLNSTATINPIAPPVVMDIISYSVCGDYFGNATVTLQNIFTRLSNNPSYIFAAYATQEQAQADNPADRLIGTHTVNGNSTIFVRVTTMQGCHVISPVPITLVVVPSFEDMNPLRACVQQGQVTVLYNLSVVRNQILNRFNSAMDIDFFHSIEDANAVQNKIVISLENELQEGNIYVRLNFSECTVIIPFEVVFTVPPAIENTVDYARCYETISGYSTFDLTSKIDYLLNGVDPATVEVRYYTTELSAQYNLDDAITQPASFVNTEENLQSIFVSVMDLESGCFSYATIQLEVINPIESTAIRYAYACDNTVNGQTTFNLSDYHGTVLPGVTNTAAYNFQFFTSPEAALANDLSQLLPAQHTILTESNPVLGVRFTHLEAGCSQTTEITLVPLELPATTSAQILPQYACASSIEETTHSFDLTIYETLIRGPIANLQLSYHTTEQAAEQGVEAIADPNNFLTSSTTVYIRVQNTTDVAAYCPPVVYPMSLVVVAVPQQNQNNLTICDPYTNGYASFDLQGQISGILGEQSTADFQVQFFKDEALTNPIATNSYTNEIAGEQIIFVKITHNSSGCSSANPFRLRVQAGLQTGQPTAQVVCDTVEENDGFQVFDLTQSEAVILAGLDPTEYAISYHTSYSAADQGLQAIAQPSAYTNTVADAQLVYVRVQGLMPTNNCYVVLDLPLRVQRLLVGAITTFNGENSICVDFETGNLLRSLTLRSAVQGPQYTYQWFYQGQAIAGATTSEYLIATAAPGNYTLQVVDTQAELVCEAPQSLPFEVLQSSAPVLVNYQTSEPFMINNFIQVNVDGFGHYGFQLNDGPILDNGGRFENVPSGEHTVRVYDISSAAVSCGELEVSGILILDYPRFFTPNGDGINDYWTIEYLVNQPEAFIQVYDRYGKLLFAFQPNTQLGWDGRVNGTYLPSTDYWFVAQFRYLGQARVFRSHFSLKR